MSTRAIAVSLALLCAGMIGADDKAKGAKDEEAIQGTWVVTSAELDGIAVKASIGDAFIFTKGKVTIETKVKKSDPVGYILDPKKPLKEIDIADTPASLGIYELKGDELKLCYEAKRPTAFNSTEGLLLTLKREKP